jgi:hypothetical protein
MTTVNSDTLDFPGIWACRYWYPNTKHDNREDLSEYRVRIDRHDNGYVMHSLPGKGEADGSQMEARFTVDGILVTGTFMEGTSPSGDWVGMTYKGAFQLLMNEDRTRMEGKWVAAGYNNGNPTTFTGRWEIVLEDKNR